MRIFKVTFSRYKDGEMRISNPQWLEGDSLIDVAKDANMMVQAMIGADPEAQFGIACIDGDLNGVQCDGARMFETADELASRVFKKEALA